MTTTITRSKKLMFAGLLSLFGLVLAACILEVTVRLFFPTTDFLWEWEPTIGMKLVPGKRGRSVKPGVFDVSVNVNSVGFRDREHSLAKPAGVRRIELVGDSFVEAIQVPVERSITTLLEDGITRSSGQTEVLNFGVSGTGTARQYLALREYGLRYKPDVVLLFFVGNDISDNSRRLKGLSYVPYSQTTSDGRLARDEKGQPLFTPFADESSRLAAVTGLMKDHWKSYRFVRELIDNSPALNRLLYSLRLMSTPPEAVNVPDGDNFGFYEIYRNPPKPVWAEAWNLTEELMVSMRDLAESHGSKFAVVLVPAAWEVYPQLWENVMAGMPALRAAALDLDHPSKRLTAYLGEHGVAVMNLLPEFRARSVNSAPLYLRGDAHWTAEGHQYAADLLTARVSAMLESAGQRANVQDIGPR